MSQNRRFLFSVLEPFRIPSFLVVIVGIILSGTLYPQYGIESMSFCSLSVLGLILFCKIKPHGRKKRVKAAVVPSAESTVFIQPLPIPEQVKNIIRKNIHVIKRGEKNEAIHVVCACHRYFQVIGFFNYLFQCCHSDNQDKFQRRLQELVSQHGLGRTIIIPRVELFYIGDMHILGEERICREVSQELQLIALRNFFVSSDQAIADVAEFVIVTQCSISSYRLQKLEGVDQCKVTLDSESCRFDNYQTPIRRIADGLFSSWTVKSEIYGLFEMAVADTSDNTRVRHVLKIIIKALYKHKILDTLESELRKSFFKNAHWFLSRIEEVKRDPEMTQLFRVL